MPTSIGLAACLALAQLERHGIDPVPILARSGLSQAALVSRSRIKVKSEIDFLERVSRAIKDEWLGLTLAADFDLRQIGMLYYVAASSERFGDALKRLDRYERVANEALESDCYRLVIFRDLSDMRANAKTAELRHQVKRLLRYVTPLCGGTFDAVGMSSRSKSDQTRCNQLC